MSKRVLFPGLLVLAALRLSLSLPPPWHGPKDALLEGFRNPPPSARPAIYYLLLNGYANRGYIDQELEAYQKAGIGGLCLFDMGARGDKRAVPPAGPAFLSPESAQTLAHIVRTAGRLGMEVDLSVTSSWDMGGSWVRPEDASMTLVSSQVDVQGPAPFDARLPFPSVPGETPKDASGAPVFHREVAVLAIPNPQPRTGHEFLFELPGAPHPVTRAVFYNSAGTNGAREFALSVSDTSTQTSAFQPLVKGTLKQQEGPQEVRFSTRPARYVRLELRGNPERVELGELELYDDGGRNVLTSHRVNRLIDGARLVRFSSAHGQLGEWAAANIHDGVKTGARGSWASAGAAPLWIRDRREIVDLSSRVGPQGRLRWNVPAGKWTILRYVCTNTGERLKVPSPNSDGLATDHLNSAATKRYIQEVADRLRPAVGNFQRSALKELYLASYEVRGQIWTPDFLDQFQQRRGYDVKPFLPVLRGALIDSEEITERVRYDYEKTLGEMLVDNYYRAASQAAHAAGLGIESEAGGPGPPIHQVPVDALQANGAIDSVRGEFWPFRPLARAMWVVKETASAAHIYGKPLVHMEAFTSSMHWQESPQSLKASADRAFCEGMNHVVWHTASHQPPEAGKPGWVYYAGTHLTPNVTWWPMARPFLDYLARTSYLLQQGAFVSDVLRYYGDQGYNFVLPKEVRPDVGAGYDDDAVNAEVILRRLTTRDGKLVLPGGLSYELLTLPERTDIDLDVLRRVEQLVAEGATVAGRKPQRSTGFSGYPGRDAQVQRIADRMWGACDGAAVTERAYGKGKVVCGSDLRRVLESRGVGPDFTYQGSQEGANLDYIHRRTANADIYFVRNRKQRWEQVDATFRVHNKTASIWLPDRGEVLNWTRYEESPKGVRVPLRLAPEGSVFVVFTPTPKGPGATHVRITSPELSVSEVQGPWEVKFAPDLGAPPSAVFSKLLPWTSHDDPGIRYFSGIAEYRAEFRLPESWTSGHRLEIDLGNLWAVGEVALNGRELGVVWKQPFRIDVSSAARGGINQLVVRVANTWSNRLIGDARSPSGKRHTRTNVTTTTPDGLPWAKVDPIPSGLFGPVRLHVNPIEMQ